MLCAPNENAPLAEPVEFRSLSGNLVAELKLDPAFLDRCPENANELIPTEQGLELVNLLQRNGLWPNSFDIPHFMRTDRHSFQIIELNPITISGIQQVKQVYPEERSDYALLVDVEHPAGKLQIITDGEHEKLSGSYTYHDLQQVGVYTRRADLVLYANSNPLVPIKFVNIQLGNIQNLFEAIQTTLKFLNQVSQVCDLENVPAGISPEDYLARFKPLAGFKRYIGRLGQFPTCGNDSYDSDKMLIECVCKCIYIPKHERVLRCYGGTCDIGLGSLRFNEQMSGEFWFYSPDRDMDDVHGSMYAGSETIETASGDVLTILWSYGNKIDGPATDPQRSWTMRVEDTTGLRFWLNWSARYRDYFALPNIKDTTCFPLFQIPRDCTSVSFDMVQPGQSCEIPFKEIPLNTLRNPENLKELIESIHEFLKSKDEEQMTTQENALFDLPETTDH